MTHAHTLGSAAWLLLLTLAACTGAQVALPADGPQTAAEVLDRALAHPLPKTAQGMTRLEAYVGQERRSVDMIVQLSMPDHVQMQAVSPTLDMLAVMATDGKRFVSFERGGAKCLVGDACPRNMARLLPIALSPQQLTPALLGRPPVLQAEPRTLAWDDKRAVYVVTVGPLSGTHQQVYVTPKEFRLAGTILWDGSKRVASMEYIGTGRVPKEMHYKAEDLDVTVTMRDVTLDAPVDDEAFALPCPDGMLREELPCGPTPGTDADAPANAGSTP